MATKVSNLHVVETLSVEQLSIKTEATHVTDQDVDGIDKVPSFFEENSRINLYSRTQNYEKWLQNFSQDPGHHGKSPLGVAYRNLHAYGFDSSTDYQKTVTNYPLVWNNAVLRVLGLQTRKRVDILKNFEGLVESGEMLMVLGRPGSGCTTLLKTIAGQTHGFFVDASTNLNYQGMYD